MKRSFNSIPNHRNTWHKHVKTQSNENGLNKLNISMFNNPPFKSNNVNKDGYLRFPGVGNNTNVPPVQNKTQKNNNLPKKPNRGGSVKPKKYKSIKYPKTFKKPRRKQKYSKK